MPNRVNSRRPCQRKQESYRIFRLVLSSATPYRQAPFTQELEVVEVFSVEFFAARKASNLP